MRKCGRTSLKRSLRAMTKELQISLTSVRRIVKEELCLSLYRMQHAHMLTTKMKHIRCSKLPQRFDPARCSWNVFTNEKLFNIEVYNRQNNCILSENISRANTLVELWEGQWWLGRPSLRMASGCKSSWLGTRSITKSTSRKFWRRPCSPGPVPTSMAAHTSSNNTHLLLTKRSHRRTEWRPIYTPTFPHRNCPLQTGSISFVLRRLEVSGKQGLLNSPHKAE